MKFEWAIFCQMCKLVSSGQPTMICNMKVTALFLPFCPPSPHPPPRRRRRRRRGRLHWPRRSASSPPSWLSSPSTTASANCSPNSEYLRHFWSTQMSWFVYAVHTCYRYYIWGNLQALKKHWNTGLDWIRNYVLKLSLFRGNQIKCQNFSRILTDQKLSLWPWREMKGKLCQPLPGPASTRNCLFWRETLWNCEINEFFCLWIFVFAGRGRGRGREILKTFVLTVNTESFENLQSEADMARESWLHNA